MKTADVRPYVLSASETLPSIWTHMEAKTCLGHYACPPVQIAPCSSRFYMQESRCCDVDSILANLLVTQGLSTEPRAVSSCC